MNDLNKLAFLALLDCHARLHKSKKIGDMIGSRRSRTERKNEEKKEQKKMIQFI